MTRLTNPDARRVKHMEALFGILPYTIMTEEAHAIRKQDRWELTHPQM